jgi:DNA-binding transcriptional MerR regulator
VTVNELARRAGIPAHVVRYYTQRGLLSPARNSRNAYREYGETDLHRLRFICKAKIIGLTLSEIDMIERRHDGGPRLSRPRSCVLVRAMPRNSRVGQRLQQRIEAAWGEADVTISEHVKLRRLIDAVALPEKSAAASSTRD